MPPRQGPLLRSLTPILVALLSGCGGDPSGPAPATNAEAAAHIELAPRSPGPEPGRIATWNLRATPAERWNEEIPAHKERLRRMVADSPDRAPDGAWKGRVVLDADVDGSWMYTASAMQLASAPRVGIRRFRIRDSVGGEPIDVETRLRQPTPPPQPVDGRLLSLTLVPLDKIPPSVLVLRVRVGSSFVLLDASDDIVGVPDVPADGSGSSMRRRAETKTLDVIQPDVLDSWDRVGKALRALVWKGDRVVGEVRVLPGTRARHRDVVRCAAFLRDLGVHRLYFDPFAKTE